MNRLLPALSLLVLACGGGGSRTGPAGVASVSLTPALSNLRVGEVAILDVSGRLVRRILRGPVAAARHEILWDGRDDEGRLVPPGVYFCRIQAGTAAATRRVVLLP